MSIRKLPPLEEITDGKYTYMVDTIVEGFITASPSIQFGDPCIIRTRIPTSAYWPWELRDNPPKLKDAGITREQVIASYAFEMGIRWQKDRKRRLRIEAKVEEKLK